MAKDKPETFNLTAAVSAGLKSGAKCDRAFDAAGGPVSLHEWRMEWFKQKFPKQPTEPVVKAD